MGVGFKYIDEDDKCYGIAGMAVAMMVWDGENLLSSISLDAPANEAMNFTSDFYFTGNPRLSAKFAWNRILEHYQLSMGMFIANIMCRNIVLHNTSISNELKNLAYKYILEEGEAVCSLENDEIKALFDKSYNYLYNIFNHSGVQNIIFEFVDQLKLKRYLSQKEVIENLQALGML
ncbi:MAG: hypothetical protein IKL35_07795 [Muribaculaceae bacterium]|nr:hypothetical protein [Muribaculaceae bacterium]